MIVFVCHNLPGQDFIVDSVAAARTHMPHERICVVDSTSPDQGYMEKLGADVEIIEGNIHYETGAWWMAFDRFQEEEEHFYFFHDNLTILKLLPEKEFLTVASFANWFGVSGHQKEIMDMCAAAFLPVPPNFNSCFGSMFGCTKELMSRVKMLRASNLRPGSRHSSQSMERVWGIIWQTLGFDAAEHALSSFEEVFSDTGFVQKGRGAARA